MSALWIKFGAAFGFLFVALGAFGAHALSGRLSEDGMRWYQTGTTYLGYHALALLALGLTDQLFTLKSTSRISGISFVTGILIFSGSLFIMAFTEKRWLGAITPLGGVAFLTGWLMFFLSFKND